MNWNFEGETNNHEMLKNTHLLSHSIPPRQFQTSLLNIYLCCFKLRSLCFIFNHNFGINCYFPCVNATVLKNTGFIYEIQF